MSGEWAVGQQFDARRKSERAALRAQVEGGAREKACDLVASDPTASATDMRRCRDRIESLTTLDARWGELSKLQGPMGDFKTHHRERPAGARVRDWHGLLPGGTTTCAWFQDGSGEGLCRPACVNSTCPSSSQLCFTQRDGAPYCNSFCY